MMGKEGHGITFEWQTFDGESVLCFRAVGTLTHEDYTHLTPQLKLSLAEWGDEPLKILVDVRAFDGWELRAAWDDFQLGREIGVRIAKAAIYGDKNWQAMAAKVGGWFIDGEMASFSSRDEAQAWLQT